MVPSHQTNRQSSGISQVASGLANWEKKIDATLCLKRHSNILKLSKGGNRSVETHLKSIKLNNVDLIRDKRVLLLDDIRTTGNSLKACKQILEQASPKSIHPLALGQSYGPDACDPNENYDFIAMSVDHAYRQQHELLCQEIAMLECYEDEEMNALKRLRYFATGE